MLQILGQAVDHCNKKVHLYMSNGQIYIWDMSFLQNIAKAQEHLEGNDLTESRLRSGC